MCKNRLPLKALRGRVNRVKINIRFLECNVQILVSTYNDSRLRLKKDNLTSMETVTASQPTARYSVDKESNQGEANSSGVSWSAVVAGGFVTAALSLILLALGTGLGLSSLSFLANVGSSTGTIGRAAIGWLILTELMSSSMGGYLAGRLRTKWTVIYSDEVYFRDTAHGFLSWCVALVVSAAFLASAATSMVGSSISAEAHSATSSTPANAYFVDLLFRGNQPKPEDASGIAVHEEAGTILANALDHGALAAQDKSYLAGKISQATGIDRPRQFCTN
jgi:hypothetical protein